MEPPKLLDGRLKLRHLVLVDALSERGSVVAAAATLRVSQPVLTRALHDLEAILGVRLYERGPRGVTPTIYGAAFTDHARAVLAQLSSAGRHVAELADAGRGTVTVGTHLAGSNLLLPRAIARLKAQHPHVTVVIHEASPEALLTDLESGRVDFVLGRLTAPSRRPQRQRRLYDEPIRLVARTGHPAAGSRELADLIDYPWVLPGSETALRGELEQVFGRRGLPLPANRIECTSILTLRNLLAETDTVAALPQLIAADDPGLVLLPVPLDPISNTVGITGPGERPLGPSARALLAQLDAVAAEMQSLASGDLPPRVASYRSPLGQQSRHSAG